MQRILLPVVALVLAFGACSTAGDGESPSPRATATLISYDEVRASMAPNAHELIQAARPGWLRKRGTVSFRMDGEILVYLDDVRLGGIEFLHGLSLDGIDSVRFLDPPAASARYGLSHSHGVIQIRARKAR